MDAEEFASDHDETGEWLWDLEDRYDLGAPDEQVPAAVAAASSDPRVATLRKRLRRNGFDQPVPVGVPAGAVAATLAGASRDAEPVADSGPPTQLWAPNSDDLADEDWDDDALLGAVAAEEDRPYPPAASRRVGMNRIAIAAGVVILLGILGVVLSRRGGHHNPGVAISATATTTTTRAPRGGLFVPVTDTTAPPAVPTTVAPAGAPPAAPTLTIPWISVPSTIPPTPTTQWHPGTTTTPHPGTTVVRSTVPPTVTPSTTTTTATTISTTTTSTTSTSTTSTSTTSTSTSSTSTTSTSTTSTSTPAGP